MHKRMLIVLIVGMVALVILVFALALLERDQGDIETMPSSSPATAAVRGRGQDASRATARSDDERPAPPALTSSTPGDAVASSSTSDAGVAGDALDDVAARVRLAAIARVAETMREAAARAGEIPVAHTPDANGIRAAVRGALPKLKECYEPWVELNPELEGSITATFMIAPDGGSPVDVHAGEGGLGSDVLDGCVLSVVESEMRFARPQRGEPIRVRYPLRFTSDDGER